MKVKSSRNRLSVLIMLASTIAIGIASRKYPAMFPSIFGKYPGDFLWGLMVFIGWAFLMPKAPSSKILILALATSYLVEFSQLYQAPWINSIRSNYIGHLFLGSTFSWYDIISYTVGIFFGLSVEAIINYLTSKIYSN